MNNQNEKAKEARLMKFAEKEGGKLYQSSNGGYTLDHNWGFILDMTLDEVEAFYADHADEESNLWSDAFDEAFEKEYNIVYEVLYSKEYKRLLEAGYVEDEARKAAHDNICDAVVAHAGFKAAEVANTAVDEWWKK